MCLDISNPIDLITSCDEICSAPENVSRRLIDYLAWSNNPEFNRETCLREMEARTPADKMSDLKYKSYEKFIFERRYRLMSSKNNAYEIAMKENPTVSNLDMFSNIDPCWSTLFPVKCFVVDHYEMARDYRGMLPFGKEVIASYNSMVKSEYHLYKSPTFIDHIRLKILTNRKSDLTGIPTVTINTLMYKHGRTLK
jgi:hypothetical protein